MKNLELTWEEIELDLKWRQDEIRFFKNIASRYLKGDEKSQFRRALILLIYAHFEGFCKFAFTLYVTALNNEKIECRDVNFAIAAASLSDLFKGLRNEKHKHEFFKKTLPDDSKLHGFARERQFIEESSIFLSKTVKIPDHYIDTESNLKPIVLKKILYKLGFDHDIFKDLDGSISRLLEYRNKIAHGEIKNGIDEKTIESLLESTDKIMKTIKTTVMENLSEKSYLK